MDRLQFGVKVYAGPSGRTYGGVDPVEQSVYIRITRAALRAINQLNHIPAAIYGALKISLLYADFIEFLVALEQRFKSHRGFGSYQSDSGG